MTEYKEKKETTPIAFPGTHCSVPTEMRVLMKIVDDAQGLDNKLVEIRKLFDYLVPRLDWVLEHKRFARSVFEKTVDLEQYDPVDAIKYRQSIFGNLKIEDLPEGDNRCETCNRVI
jgi:hypothetical protein